MKRIGIIGANGQVGLEVSLLLSVRDDVEVVAFCRNPVASAVCRRFGLDVRHYNIADPSGLTRAFEDLDLLVDMTLPVGTAAEMRLAIDKLLTAVLGAASKKTAFVYTSSVAVTIAPGGPVLPFLFLPRTPYAAAKRFGEARAGKLARARGIAVSVLRLGQVHGRLQAVSLDLLAGKTPALEEPGPPTCVVFCRTIADALSALAEGREPHDRYTLLSEPRWRLDEIAALYADGSVPASTAPRPSGSTRDARPATPHRWARALLDQVKPLASSVVLPRFPGLEARLATRWRHAVAAGEIAALPDAVRYWSERIVLGTPGEPGMSSLPDIRADPFGPEPPALIVKGNPK